MDSSSSLNRSQNVYLLVTPLSCYYKYKCNRVDLLAAKSENHRVPFQRLQHWAIQVGDDATGNIYEVTSFWTRNGDREMHVSTAKEWRKARSGRPRRKWFIAVTATPSRDLEKVAWSIWDTVCEDQYRAMSRNCQSFAVLFKEVIEDRELLTEEASSEIDDMPSSFNPLYAVLHLRQARSAVVRWTRKVLNRDDIPTEGGMSGSYREQEQARLPARRVDRWLQLVNEVSNRRDVREQDDFRAVIEEANRIHRLERESTRRRPARKSSTY